MLVLEHIRQLVELARPRNDEEYKRFFAQITPVQYGNIVNFPVALVTNYTLAEYQIPREIHHVVLRVESYMVDWETGATDFGNTEPVYDGTAFWAYTPFGTGTTYQLTPNAAIQTMIEVDPFYIFGGGYNLSLIANFLTAPDDDRVRRIRTLVYGYDVGTEVADRTGIDQRIVAPTDIQAFI